MIDIILYIENISSDFLKIYNYYFQNILFNYIVDIAQNDKNLIYIKKELYAKKSEKKR